MVVAIGIGLGMMGLVVGLLGILCTYIWKGNQKMEKALLAGQERLMAGLERLEEGQKEIAQILKDHTQMLLEQTKILERIEGKISLVAS